jgi:hypothetical protein
MKKNTLLLVFILSFGISGFSQDSTYVRAIHKTSSEDLKPANGASEAKVLPKNKESIYSCEPTADKKSAVITILSPAIPPPKSSNKEKKK